MLHKDNIIDLICSKVKRIDATIVRVYGVSNGVGYDIAVTLYFKGDFSHNLEAHAVRQSWAGLGYLRPNNSYYQYTGKCDIYQDEVIDYWTTKYDYSNNTIWRGLREYLNRFKKFDLEAFYLSLGFKGNYS